MEVMLEGNKLDQTSFTHLCWSHEGHHLHRPCAYHRLDPKETIVALPLAVNSMDFIRIQQNPSSYHIPDNSPSGVIVIHNVIVINKKSNSMIRSIHAGLSSELFDRSRRGK
jgi:hypothetical protein